MHDDLASRLDPCSITAQLAAYGLLPAIGGSEIDLSSPSPDDHRPPPRQKRKRNRAPAGMPVLRAVASEDGRTLRAYCPWCRREHVHGRHGACGPPECGCKLHADLHRHHDCTCPPGSGDGHRQSHCRPGSPLAERGYYVVEVGP
jgi:hypothetical protein